MAGLMTKVSGITSLTDARYCAGMGVSFLGILFDENGKGNLDRNAFVSISGWIEGPRWVGEYAGNDLALISDLASNYGLHIWQVGRFDLAKQILSAGMEVGLKMTAMDFLGDFPSWPKVKPTFVQLEDQPESLTTEIWEKLTQTGLTFLIQAHSQEAVTDIQQQFPGAGICLFSGEEERPGWMDLSGLQDILEMIEE